MNATEKYNHAIALIEELVADRSYTTQDIGVKVALENGTSLRDMSNVFRFMADTTLYSYVSRRRLNAAYHYLITPDNGNSSILEAVDISGYSDQPSFTKAFKKKYNLTPREAQKLRDSSKLEPPLTWDILSGDSPSISIEQEETPMNESTIFGVKKEDLNRISKILSLEAFYGFTRTLSEYAFTVHENTHQSIDDCFSYVESVCDYKKELDEERERQREEYYLFDDEEPEEADEETRIKEIGENSLYQEIFFAKGISVSFIAILTEKYYATKEDLLQCDMVMLKAYPPLRDGTYMNFKYYRDAYRYWTSEFQVEETENTFAEYINLFYFDYSFEEALMEVYTQAMEECGREDELYEGLEPPSMEEMFRMAANDEYDLHFERWASEQTSSWDDDRIDDDLYYDPDNPDTDYNID